MVNIDILNGCEWMAADSKGVVTASKVSQEFWNLWRAQKDVARAMGFRVRPDGNGGWVVTHAPSLDVFVPSAAVPPSVGFKSDDVKLSDEQVQIIGWFVNGKGNLVVVARAGTGKTFTIVRSLAQAPEKRKLYAVFNKKNQKEAQLKIRDPRVDVLTLHAVGRKCIVAVWPKSKPDDKVEWARINAVCGAGIPDEVGTAIHKLVGFAKNLFIEVSVDDIVALAEDRMIEAPEGFEAENLGGWSIQKIAAKVVAVMELSKVSDAENRISFNDMVWLPVVMGWVHPQYDLVVVDEAQDMNLLQLTMAMRLVTEAGRMCVVGDDRQAIYAFRGACSDGLAMMRDRLNAARLGLTITYRCPKQVVSLAAKVVPDYRAHDSAPQGSVSHMGEDGLAKVAKIGDAVLSRANAPLMPLCLSLLRQGIPARVEGKDIGKELIRLVGKIKGNSVAEFLKNLENWEKRMVKRFSKLEDGDAKIELIHDQAAVLGFLAEGMKSVKEIVDRITYLFETDTKDGNRPAVVFSSVHKAKGLEWNNVFIVGSSFRSRPDLDDQPGDLTGEEANIYYVAVTRAKKNLTFLG